MKPDEEEDVSWVRLWGNEYRRCFKSRAFSKRNWLNELVLQKLLCHVILTEHENQNQM